MCIGGGGVCIGGGEGGGVYIGGVCKGERGGKCVGGVGGGVRECVKGEHTRTHTHYLQATMYVPSVSSNFRISTLASPSSGRSRSHKTPFTLAITALSAKPLLI